jgi:protocatechuate 3,4-dioxygenase beta subunit
MGRLLLVCVVAALVAVAVALTTCGEDIAPGAAPRASGVDEDGTTARVRAERAAPADSSAQTSPAPAPSSGSASVADGEATFHVFPEGTRVAMPEHVLEGRVVDEAGAPLEGIRVELASCWLPAELAQVPRFDAQFRLYLPHALSAVRTDAGGSFRLRYFEGGNRELLVYRADRVVALVRQPCGVCMVTLSDVPTELVVRVVCDTDSGPVAGASVNVPRQATSSDARPDPWDFVASIRGGRTDRQGRVDVTGLIRGPATVWVRAAGYAPGPHVTAIVPGRDVEVRVRPGFLLRGRVIDGDSATPIIGAQVMAPPAGAPGECASTGRDGGFSIEHALPTHVREFGTAAVSADGYADERLLAGYVDDTRTCDVIVALHRPATVRVRCVGSDGAPVANVIVHAISRYEAARQTIGGVTPPRAYFDDSGSADTDADGRATIDGLHPGSDGVDLTVRFYVDGVPVLERTFPPLAAREERDLGDVVLAPGLTLRGTVLDADGRPAGGITVAAAPADAEDEHRSSVGRALIGDGGRRAETGADGRFALVGLAPGLWDLYAAADFATPGTLRAGVDARSGDVTLRLPRLVPLAGRVLDAQGAAVPQACVGVTSRDAFGMDVGMSVLCDDEGRFEFDRFPEGAGDVDVEVAVKSAPPQRFRVRPGEPAELRLR